MPTFEYQAKDSSGRPASGRLEAPDRRGALNQVREQGMWVTHLEEIRAQSPPPASPVLPAASLKELMVAFRQFATMMKAGMSINQCLRTLAAQTANRKLREAFARMSQEVQQGMTLSRAMEQHPALFSLLQTRLVEAGETGGMLDRMLVRIADYLEHDYNLILLVRRSTFYPRFVAVSALFVVFVPTLVLQGVFPFLSSVLRIALMVALPLGAVWLFFRMGSLSPSLRQGLDSFKLALPLWGKVARQLAVARFARAFGALFAGGVSPARSLILSAEVCGNTAISERLKEAAPMIQSGKGLTDALRPTRVFPEMVLNMLATGEQTGKTDEMMDKVAEYYEAEAEVSIRAMATASGPLLLIIIAIPIVLTIINFYTGYFNQMLQSVDMQ
ncbi:MAG: type II secretion system F family protein [Armatimonadetes bacterium]|nr:type II secretion system F family protein [Armatimonadota bacterium]